MASGRKRANLGVDGWRIASCHFLASCLAKHWRGYLSSFAKLYKVAGVFSKPLEMLLAVKQNLGATI